MHLLALPGQPAPHPSQPQSFLTDLAGKGYVKYSLTGVLRESYSLPDRIKDAPTTSASPNAAHREITHILRRTCIRARRLLNGIVKAMADELNPMTLEEAMSRVGSLRRIQPRPGPSHLHLHLPQRPPNLPRPRPHPTAPAFVDLSAWQPCRHYAIIPPPPARRRAANIRPDATERNAYQRF